jgi:dihydrofolate reductase
VDPRPERGGCAAGRVDALVVATALSTIRVDLGASLEQLEWTVNAYVLSFAVLMMSAAALGDRIALSEPPPACARGCRRPWPQETYIDKGGNPMRKVIVSTYVTLDGRVDEIQDWAVPYDDDEAAKYHTDLLMNSDGLLLGRKTYEIFGANSRARSGESPYIDRINSMAKYIASTTLKDLEWENSHLIEGDVPEGVAKLKEEPGQNLIMYGCRDLMHSLLEHDLIDEYRIWVHPVVLGKGMSFFKDGVERMALDLVDTTVLSSGVAILEFQSQQAQG